MLALRSFARAIPRASIRTIPVRAIQRPLAISRPSILSRATAYKSFSTTRTWREAAGDSDAELVAKLALEHSLETSGETSNKLPQELEDFLSDSHFTIQDQPGTENIVLTRQFGNETIRIECNINDMNQEQEVDDLEDDGALEDEPFSDPTSGGKRTINQSKGGRIDVMPEDSIAPADRAGEDGAEMPGSFNVNLNITIDKGAIGATQIVARAEDNDVVIEYVYYYPRADLIDPHTTEALKEAENVYGGPAFPYLDPDLQAMFENYVAERGINTQLTWFLSRYIDYKEQREYMLWLENMKKFVEA